MGCFVLLTTMRLKRKDDVEKHKEREHERLDESDEQLESDERKHEARNEQQRGKDGENDLAAPDVAPESERQRKDAEQLAEEFDRTDEDEHHDADERPLLERGEVDPAREVAEPVLLDARPLVPDESRQGEAEVGVVVGGRRVEQLDLPDEGDDAEPVREEGEQEESPEERQEAHDRGTAGVLHEVDERLDDELDEPLEAPRYFADGARGGHAEGDQHRHHEPSG